jgi:cytochrome c biogenesis protein CcdA
MVGTIVPMVYGERQRRAYSFVAGVYTAGSIAGALVVGAAFILAGKALHSLGLAVPSESVAGIVGAALSVAVLRELQMWSFPVSLCRWQVPRRWVVEYSPHTASFAYGAVLGFTLLTRLETAAFAALAFTLAIQPDVTAGLLLAAVYGLGRAVPVHAAAATTSDGEELSAFFAVATNADEIGRQLVASVMAFGAGGMLSLDMI